MIKVLNCTRQIYYGFQHSAALYKCKAWRSVKFPPGRFLFKQKNIAISQTARGQPIKSPHLTPSPCHTTTQPPLCRSLQPYSQYVLLTWTFICPKCVCRLGPRKFQSTGYLKIEFLYFPSVFSLFLS